MIELKQRLDIEKTYDPYTEKGLNWWKNLNLTDNTTTIPYKWFPSP